MRCCAGPAPTACSGRARLPARDALAVHWDQEIGTLERGMRAYFVVLDHNPMDVDPERIADIGVLAPNIGGRPA